MPRRVFLPAALSVLLVSLALVGCSGRSVYDRNDDPAAAGGTPGASRTPDPSSGRSSSAGSPSSPDGSDVPEGAGGATRMVDPNNAGRTGGPEGEGGAIGPIGAGDAGAPSEAGSPSAENGGAGDEPRRTVCNPIAFSDPELEATVRAEVQKPNGPLTSSDVAGLSFLATPSVTSLDGIECLTDLTSLDLGSLPPGKIKDLSPLASLLKLEDISLARNPIASLEPLGKLPKLSQIFLSHVPVELDLTPLATAPTLSYLDIDADTVKDLAPLGSVSTLRSLHFRNGTLLTPTGVAALQSLEELDAPGVFSDATPLAGLSRLQKLRISNRVLSNFALLGGLVNLRLLDINATGVNDIAPVAQMPKLVAFFAHGDQITDISALRGLGQLSLVDLIGNQITDLTPLADNASLSSGSFVYVLQNPLVCAAQAANIQAMQNRSASVVSDCP